MANIIIAPTPRPSSGIKPQGASNIEGTSTPDLDNQDNREWLNADYPLLPQGTVNGASVNIGLFGAHCAERQRQRTLRQARWAAEDAKAEVF
jgi:hypothetical protein